MTERTGSNLAHKFFKRRPTGTCDTRCFLAALLIRGLLQQVVGFAPKAYQPTLFVWPGEPTAGQGAHESPFSREQPVQPQHQQRVLGCDQASTAASAHELRLRPLTAHLAHEGARPVTGAARSPLVHSHEPLVASTGLLQGWSQYVTTEIGDPVGATRPKRQLRAEA